MSDAPTELSARLTRNNLQRLAWGRSFGRGEEYFDEGAVGPLRMEGGKITAKVSGTRTYRVSLWAEDGNLVRDCTCPVGMDGLFCKHCVAVGLAWLDNGLRAEGTDTPAFGEANLRDYLSGLDKNELAAMLLERAGEDERLHRRLMTRAAGAAETGPDLSVWRGSFDDALQMDDYVGYRDMYDYGTGIEEVVESVAGLLADGKAEAVIELAEYALEAVEEAIEYVDDSDGWMGGLLDHLQELHLSACLLARPDPVELAQRLFEYEMESGYGVFRGAAETYRDVLGEAGLAEYRKQAEADWAKVPVLAPGEKDPERYGKRFRITSVMEALAKTDGDLEQLVAVKSRDLSMPYDFLDIAQVYQDAGQAEEALEWAERGWESFPGERADDRLREFIADAYHRRKRHDEAMALTWDAFAGRPAFEMYKVLERHARKARQWPSWRDKALSTVRESIAEAKGKPVNQWSRWDAPSGDHSVLVQIFLHEKDMDAAWREAGAGGCSEDLWLELAKRREKTHPADSVRIYEARVARVLRHTGNRVYEEAVEYLGKIEKLLSRSEQETAFRTLVTGIRATHKRKRNLMKMLDDKGW